MSSAPASVKITPVPPDPYNDALEQTSKINPHDRALLMTLIAQAKGQVGTQQGPCKPLLDAARSADRFLPSTLPIITILLSIERQAGCGPAHLAQRVDFPRLSDLFLAGGRPQREYLFASASSGLPITFTATGPCVVQRPFVTVGRTGVCKVTASQAGNPNFKPASATRSFTTTAPATTNLSLSCPAHPYAGQPITVSGSVVGAPAQPLQVVYQATGEAGQPSLTHTVHTDPSGAYADSSGAPADATTYTITVRYAGDTTHHLPAQASCNVTVTPPPPPPPPATATETLSLACPQNTIASGQQIPVFGSLSPAISAAPITITYATNGQTAASHTVTSNSSGNFSDQGPPGQAGTYTISASYPGDSSHAAASATCSITVTPTAVAESLTISCAQSVSTGNLVASGSLSPAIAGAPITITYAAPGQTTVTDNTTTDGSGNYTDTGPFGKPSTTYTITANYPGDGTHQPATASCQMIPS